MLRSSSEFFGRFVVTDEAAVSSGPSYGQRDFSRCVPRTPASRAPPQEGSTMPLAGNNIFKHMMRGGTFHTQTKTSCRVVWATQTSPCSFRSLAFTFGSIRDDGCQVFFGKVFCVSSVSFFLVIYLLLFLQMLSFLIIY